jgi:hypothetical protein
MAAIFKVYFDTVWSNEKRSDHHCRKHDGREEQTICARDVEDAIQKLRRHRLKKCDDNMHFETDENGDETTKKVRVADVVIHHVEYVESIDVA